MSLSESFSDRQYMSRFSVDPLSLVIHKRGVVADADANMVMVTMRVPVAAGLPPTVVFSRQATQTAPGTYEVLLSSQETAAPGLYEVQWDYALDAIPQVFTGLVEIGESSPAYDALEVGFKQIIESVWMRFADLFDSPNGGPHLQVYFQSQFGRGRMAQLLNVALQRLNIVAQPHQTFSLAGPPDGPGFPITQWGGLLDQALYIETLKHLIRSYTEQPDAAGVAVARLDRRDYMMRWQSVLDMEAADFRSMMDNFKIAFMGLGRPRVLVSGGIFGNYAATRAPFAPARGRAWAAYY